jgi:hypothetical protein
VTSLPNWTSTSASQASRRWKIEASGIIMPLCFRTGEVASRNIAKMLIIQLGSQQYIHLSGVCRKLFLVTDERVWKASRRLEMLTISSRPHGSLDGYTAASHDDSMYCILVSVASNTCSMQAANPSCFPLNVSISFAPLNPHALISSIPSFSSFSLFSLLLRTTVVFVRGK